MLIDDLCIQIGNAITIRSAATSFDVELRREQNNNTSDLLSYVQSNISKLLIEQNGIYYQIMQTIDNVEPYVE